MADSAFFDHQHARRLLRDRRPTLRRTRIQRRRAGGDHRSRLADDGARELAPGPHQRTQGGFLSGVEQHHAARLQLGQQLHANAVDDNQAVFRRATGSVVKGLRTDNAVGGERQISALVDDSCHVAGADAKGRRSTGVCSAHIGLRTGRYHQVALAHQFQRRRLAHRRRQQLHQIVGRADAVKLRVDECDQTRAGAPSLGRRSDDDGVAAFERIDDLVGRCGARICRRCDGANHADRSRDFNHPLGRVFADHANRLCSVEVAQKAEGLAVVFAHLVLDIADAGIGDGALCEFAVARGFDDRPARRRDQRIDAQLVIAIGDPLRRARARHQIADHRGDRSACFACYRHHVSRPGCSRLLPAWPIWAARPRPSCPASRGFHRPPPRPGRAAFPGSTHRSERC